MITLQRNKRKMYYALQGLEVPSGEVEYYTDSDGNKYPIGSDETEIGYFPPQEMNATVNFGSGEIEAQEFGLSVSDYDATFTTVKGLYPLKETSLIWLETEPIYKDEEKTIVDDKSADYRIVSIKPSTNFTKYIIKKLVK